MVNRRNWSKLGRGKLQLLAWSREDILEVNIFGLDKFLDDNQKKKRKFKSMIDQAKTNRYAISCEGFCGWADRLKHIVFLKSTILLQETPCHEYYQDLMEPYVHYIPFDADFKNLASQIEWATHNHEAAERIANNALALANEHLTEEAIQCYMNSLFSKYAALIEYQVELRPQSKPWTKTTTPDNLLSL